MWYCYINSCLWLQLWSTLACHFLALLLLNIIPGRFLTCYSTLPWMLAVMHISYEITLAMLSFLNMSTSFWLPCHAMGCPMVSYLSLQSCYHESVYAMLYFSSKSEIVNITCHVCMGATSFFMPLWVIISKGVLFYVFSNSMPCLCFPWHVPVACCFLALNIAIWCCFAMFSIFSKSVKLLSFAFLPCYFELVLVGTSRSLVFMICRASCVLYTHIICFHVGVQ